MLGAWLRRLAALFTRRRLDAELDEEIRIHLEMATEEYVRRGMSQEDAQREARRAFGGVEQMRERHREARGLPWLDHVLRDLQLAARTLLRDRGFTLTVIVTLAVAIGADAAIFSVVDAVLLRPLPYPDAERVVSVGREGQVAQPGAFTDPQYRQFREQGRAFQEVGAYRTAESTLTDGGEPMRASVGLMTNSAFATLAVSPQRGRLPTDEEDLPGGPPVVVISHALWVARFNVAPSAVGATIELNDTTRQVIGVMPPEFDFPSERTDVWIPLQIDPASQDPRRWNLLVARLGEGVTLQDGSADADRIVQATQEPAPGSPVRRYDVVPLKDRMIGDSQRLLLVVFGGMSLVLLIALANVAGLFVVRGEGRSRQTAVRAALGASRRRLAQHALSESVLLALAGGFTGLMLAHVGARVLVAIGPASVPRLEGVGVSWTVVGCTVAAAVLAGLAFGLVPSLAARPDAGLAPSLSAGGRGATVGGDRLRLRGLLVVTQVALAVALVIGSGLMVRSYGELASVDPGFDGSDVTSFGLVLPAGRYDNASANELYRELVERLRARPGVEAAAVTTVLPVSPFGGNPRMFGPSYQLQVDGVADSVDVFPVRWVTPGYFEALRIPIVSGRTMLPEDREAFRLFISRSFAERYWPGGSAIGQRMGFGGATWASVVGVVGDVHLHSLDAPSEEAAYLPMGSPSPSILSVSVVVRTNGRDADLPGVIRSEVRALDPDVPVIDMQSMGELVAGTFAMSRARFAMLVLAVAALVALSLGAVGIYGVIAYVVSQRRQEIGVRMALGARSSHILSRIVGRSLAPAALGVAAGVGTGVLGGRVLASLLFQTSPLDAATFVAGPAVLLAVAVAACVVPARRAMAIDPAEALRSE